MVNYQIKTLKTNETRKHGADELWIAVLARAVEDALREDKNDQDLDRRAARYWFRNYSSDFRLVCELAGRNAPYVREKCLSESERIKIYINLPSEKRQRQKRKQP